VKKFLSLSSLVLAISCGGVSTDPTPTTTPTPVASSPTPTPSISPSPNSFSCYLDGTKYDLTKIDRKESEPLGRAVNVAISVVTNCKIFDPSCEIHVHPQDFMDEVINQLQRMGYCAGQLEPGETDEIAAAGFDTRNKVPGKIWHSFHVFSGHGWDDFSFPGNVVWYYEGTGEAIGSYRGTWEAIKQ